ncbi:histidine kinase [Vibrio tritonius]|nr:histidine kinase [Vibrio tritonius]
MRLRTKSFWYGFFLVRKISLIMLLLALLSVTGMIISENTSASIQGNAHMINRVGSIRMQSYRILTLDVIHDNANKEIRALENELTAPSFQKFIRHEKFGKAYQAIINLWYNTTKPKLLSEQNLDTKLKSIEQFVTKLNVLISQIDKHTEKQILTISITQKVFMILTVLFLILAFTGLHKRLFVPWRKLLHMANTMRGGDFSLRFESKKYRDEMAELGSALNSMAHDLSLMYTDLEQRVQQKTNELKQQNQYLDFLYRSGRTFNHHYLDIETLTPLFLELLELLEINRIIFYPNESLHYLMRDKLDCQASKQISERNTPLNWILNDESQECGSIIIYPKFDSLPPEQLQFLETFCDFFTQYLSSLMQDQHKHQLLVLEERHTIARELHDSIAQSLSYLKIKSGILRINSANFSEEQHQTLQDISKEINNAYTQLRELLMTFRLKLDETKLSTAIVNSINEYNKKLGLTIDFKNNWPDNIIPPRHEIHILQIIRESLSNIYKHANATEVKIHLTYNQECYLTISDNGIGLDPNAKELSNHFGLTIIADRVKSLSGQLEIHSDPTTGTDISISFPPQLKE